MLICWFIDCILNECIMQKPQHTLESAKKSCVAVIYLYIHGSVENSTAGDLITGHIFEQI